MRHTLTILVENESGVLSRVAGLFSGRGFNIESLTVAETLEPDTSRMTIVTHGNDQIIEQIIKQLHKLINTIKVTDLTGEDFIEREMVMIKVSASEPNARAEVLRLVEVFRAKVIDVSPRSFTLELTGNESKVTAFIEMLKPMGIKDFVRTGKVVLQRGNKAAKSKE